jgi:hypothetical protein
MAELPDVLSQTNRRYPTNPEVNIHFHILYVSHIFLKLEFQLHPDGTTTHASLANEKIKPNILLPAIQLRLEHKDEPNEAATENGQRKGSLQYIFIVRIFVICSSAHFSHQL